MIVRSSLRSDLFATSETDIDVVQFDPETGLTSVAVGMTVDLAQCLIAGILTLQVEVLQPSPISARPTRTVDTFNSAALSASTSRTSSSKLERVVAAVPVDITRLIPNSVTRVLNSGGDESKIREAFGYKTVAKQSQLEVVTVSNSSDAYLGDFTSASRKILPGSRNLGSLVNDSLQALRSTTSKSGYAVSSTGPTSSVSASIGTQRQDVKKIVVNVSYRQKREITSSCVVRVRASARSGDIQVSNLRPRLGDLIDQYLLPKISPLITCSADRFGVVVASVTQKDTRADSVNIVYRTTRDHLLPSVGFTSANVTVPCPPGMTVQVKVPGAATASVVRAFAAKDSRVASVFSGAVAGKMPMGIRRARPYRLTTLTCVNQEKGVVFAVNALPGATAVLLRRRDLRNNQVSVVTKGPVLIEDVSSLYDMDAQDLVPYRYELDAYTDKGDVIHRDSSFEIRRFKPRGLVSLQMAATPSTADNQVVNVRITSSVKPTDVDFLIKYMQSSGIDTAFQTDLETLRKGLQDCVRFDVYRIDLQTAEIKFVGRTTSEIVDDIDDVKVKSKFIYVCETFIRSPSQVTDIIADRVARPAGINPDITRLGLHITKLDVDKNVSVRSISTARKFFSKSVFETGTMPSSPAAEAFDDGATGDVAYASVEVDPPRPVIGNLQVISHQGLPCVTWSVSGNIDLVDRFVVRAGSAGASWVVGAAASATNNKSFFVQDTISYSSGRVLTYSVTPVYLNGVEGEAVLSSPYTYETREAL